MNLNRINKIEDYQSLTNTYCVNKIYSNDYIQNEVGELINKGSLSEYHTESNLFLFVKKDFGMRVYYYIGNTNEIADFSNQNNLVVEILYRGEKFYPQNEIDYLQKCGFEINLIRDQYCGVYKDLNQSEYINNNVIISFAENLKEVETSCLLFNDTFDNLSGDFISPSSYSEYLEKRQILIAKDNENNFLGALHQTIEKGVAWISHVVVLSEARGKHVGQALLNEFVQKQNTVAVNMYEKKGFKYLNKSTISLIKK